MNFESSPLVSEDESVSVPALLPQRSMDQLETLRVDTVSAQGTIDPGSVSFFQRVGGKPRSEDQLCLRASGIAGQLHSIHPAGHDDVRYQQVDSAVLRHNLQGLLAIFRMKGGVPHVGQVNQGNPSNSFSSSTTSTVAPCLAGRLIQSFVPA